MDAARAGASRGCFVPGVGPAGRVPPHGRPSATVPGPLGAADRVGGRGGFSGAVQGSATFAELQEFLATADDVIAYRDPKGRRIFGGISGLSGQERDIEETASFMVTAVDFTEEEVPA